MNFRIRMAEERDLDGIVVLERTVAEAPHWNRRDYAAMIQSAATEAVSRCLLVAEVERDDKAAYFAGFAVGKVIDMGRDAVGELESVVVSADARRTGIGRGLCLGILNWCREKGASVVELEVRSQNGAARSLYGALGFAEEGLRKQYYSGPADDAVLMRIQFDGRPMPPQLSRKEN